MPNIHITATSLLLSCLSTESICQKFSVKLKYGKENRRNHERGFPARETKSKQNEILSPASITMDNYNTWNKDKIIHKPEASGR